MKCCLVSIPLSGRELDHKSKSDTHSTGDGINLQNEFKVPCFVALRIAPLVA